MNHITVALDAAHQRFFRLMGIDPDTGSGSASGDRKFAGYPFMGSMYGAEHRVRKLLVVSLDASRDQNPGGGPTRDTGQFEQATTDPDINPHMAGVCFTTLRYAFPPRTDRSTSMCGRRGRRKPAMTED